MRRTLALASLAATLLSVLLWPGPAPGQTREIQDGTRRNSPYRSRPFSRSTLRDKAREKLEQEKREREEARRKQEEIRRTDSYHVEGRPDRDALIQQEARQDYLRSVHALEQARAEARQRARQQQAPEPSYWHRMLVVLRDVPVSLSMIGLGLLVGLLVGLRARPRH